MKVKSCEKKENSIVEVIVEADAQEFDAAVQKVYNKQKNKIQLPGFRKGKASRKMIEKMYGVGVFYEDAINDLYPEMYSVAVEDQKLKSVAYPQVNVESVGVEGLTMKFDVTVEPEVKLGEYKGLSAKKDSVRVTESDIKAEMESYVKRATILATADREAKIGDTAVIDFEGFDNGVAFEGGKGDNFSLELGSGSFVPGFEEQVVGMKAGEEKDIDITFPEDYTPELAGKPVVFHVKCNEVKEPKTPELDDEFAKDVSEFDTFDEFKADLKSKIKARKESQSEKNFENAIMEQLVANCEIEVPQAMKEFRADQLVEQQANRIQSMGMDFNQYLEMMGVTATELRNNAIEAAEPQIKTELALKAVAAAENMELTDEEKNEKYEELSKQYSMTVEQIKGAISEEAVFEEMLMDKATKFVVDNAKVAKKTTKKAEEEKTEE